MYLIEKESKESKEEAPTEGDTQARARSLAPDSLRTYTRPLPAIPTHLDSVHQIVQAISNGYPQGTSYVL